MRVPGSEAEAFDRERAPGGRPWRVRWIRINCEHVRSIVRASMEDVLPCKFVSIRRHISTAFFENLTLGRAAATRLSALAARVRGCRSNLRQVFSRQAAKGGCGSATRSGISFGGERQLKPRGVRVRALAVTGRQ